MDAKNVKIWCFIGPSGTGKTHLTNRAVSYFNAQGENNIGTIVSHTTRAMRAGETDGVDYYFISKKEFDKLDKAESTCYAGNYYCISKEEVSRILNNYKKVFVVVEINGYRQLKEAYGDEAASVFIETPEELLEERLKMRGDSPENINIRMANLKQSNEMENKKYCDFVFKNEFPAEPEEKTLKDFYEMCINDLKLFD
jgi:guanylate kinase